MHIIKRPQFLKHLGDRIKPTRSSRVATSLDTRKASEISNCLRSVLFLYESYDVSCRCNIFEVPFVRDNR